jgi:hypothetical protein
VRVDELCVGRSDGDVGVDDPHESASDAKTVHCRDDRLSHALIPGSERNGVGLLNIASEYLGTFWVGQVDEVNTAAERPARAATDDHHHRLVIVKLDPGFGQLGTHNEIHGIACARPVEQQPTDGASPFDDQCLVVSRRHR